MRQLAKKIVLVLWLLGAIAIGTVFRQNIEQEAAKRGLDSLLGEGLGIVTASGYEAALLWSFAILTGMVLATQGEWLLRKWDTRRKIENWQHFTVDWAGGRPIIEKLVGVDAVTILDGQVMGNIYDSDPKVSCNAIALIIQFDCEIAEPCPYVFADRKIIWREVKGGTHYLVLEIDLRSKEDVAFAIIVRPLAWSGEHKFDAPMRWHDATDIPREKVLEAPKSERRSLRWLPNIASRMQR
jgi:hypothetical protein